jgi:hypothetical protein
VYYAAPLPERVYSRFSGWCWPRPITDSRGMRYKSYALLAASYLTDPICRMREIPWEMRVVDYGQLSLSVQWLACSVTAIFTTVPGIMIRKLVCCFQREPYIHLKGTAEPKSLEKGDVILYSANLANVAGGYSITDGGVAPWTYRIDAQVEKIREQDADVLCLSELFDLSASFYLYEELKKLGYTDFYFNMGMKAAAPGSGLFVASKYAIQTPQFGSFPQTTLQGRTKWACKGSFRFDIVSGEDILIRFYTTHLQHSEEPGYPKRNQSVQEITHEVIEKALKEDCLDEVVARAAQMHMIIQDILGGSSFDKPTVLTGDLNLNDEEIQQSLWKDKFDPGTLNYKGKKTWGGDEFCVGLVNGAVGSKKVSESLNLDHTLLYKGRGRATLETKLVDMGFDGKRFTREALSDHNGLLSKISIKQ